MEKCKIYKTFLSVHKTEKKPEYNTIMLYDYTIITVRCLLNHFTSESCLRHSLSTAIYEDFLLLSLTSTAVYSKKQ